MLKDVMENVAIKFRFILDYFTLNNCLNLHFHIKTKAGCGLFYFIFNLGNGCICINCSCVRGALLFPLFGKGDGEDVNLFL